MLSKCTPLEYPLLTCTDPLVVRGPPIGKEKALTNQRPFCHSMWSNRGCAGKASANQRLSHHWVRRVLSSAIGDPYKLRCASTLGQSWSICCNGHFGLVQLVALQLQRCSSSQGRRLPQGPSAYYSKVAFVFFLV